jgi:kinesin family protein 5
MVEKLREQVMEQEELIASLRKEYESLQTEQQRIQAENDSAKDEVTYEFLTCHCRKH